MHPFQAPEIREIFDAAPAPARAKWLALRELVFATAAATPGVGVLTETLKWGEPAYLTTQTKSGSTIRLAYKPLRPDQIGIYFNCQTTLVDTFRAMFPNDFRFEGNRALILAVNRPLATDALSVCFAAALTYHRAKKLNHEVRPHRLINP